MALTLIKAQLEQLLKDPDTKVIALAGKWGTGKTFMWEQVKAASKDEGVRGAIYASLFGLSSVDQIKVKLLQGAVPAAAGSPKVWKAATGGIAVTLKALEGLHKSFGAATDLGLLLIPSMLKGKVIVLDDLERKHEKLHIDEVLGFIDEFTQQHGSRFVLILNDDKLDRREVWETLREKVVDQELCLTTSATEAFQIAIGLTPSTHAESIRTAVEKCGLTNIRIVGKVIKAVNRVLEGHDGLSDAVLTRVIPSTVLLAAIHYRGIEDGPDFDFVLAHGTGRGWSDAAAKNAPGTEDSARRSRWNLLLQELQIMGCDGFELLITEFLQSGLFDPSKVGEIIGGYVDDAERMDAQNSYRGFLERLHWDHSRTETELVEDAAELAGRADLLDAFTVTAFHRKVSELPGGKGVGDLAVANWIEGFRKANPGTAPMDDLFHRELHPQIKAEFDSINAKVQAGVTLFETCDYLATHNGWNSREEFAMKSSTVADMESILRNYTGQDLKRFMCCMLKFSMSKIAFERHFGSAMDNFIHACQNVASDSNSGRLGRLVKDLFSESGAAGLLDSKVEQAPTEIS